jgi:hypothetical protein
MSRNITPSLGINLDYIYGATERLDVPLGTVMRGADGRMWILAQASAGIANNTAVILTEPAMTIAAGAGSFTTRKGALTTGQRAWVQSNAI